MARRHREQEGNLVPDKKLEAPAILLGDRTDRTGIMRGRDVRFLLRGKAEPATIEVLAAVAERGHTTALQLAQLAQMCDVMLNIIQQFADISANMKDKMDAIHRSAQAEVEGDEGAAAPRNHTKN